MSVHTIDEKIRIVVNKIIYDLTDRCGIGDEWYNIDEETQEDIKEAWGIIIKKGLE